MERKFDKLLPKSILELGARGFFVASLTLSACAPGAPGIKPKTNSNQATEVTKQQPINATGSATPKEAAEGFIKTAIKKDLNETRRYFAPDKQPSSWDQVFALDSTLAYSPSPEPKDHLKTSLSRCANVNFTSVERPVTTGKGVITITFNQACISSWGIDINKPSGNNLIPVTHRMLTVPVEQANNRWYAIPFFREGNQEYHLNRVVAEQQQLQK